MPEEPAPMTQALGSALMRAHPSSNVTPASPSGDAQPGRVNRRHAARLELQRDPVAARLEPELLPHDVLPRPGGALEALGELLALADLERVGAGDRRGEGERDPLA